MKDQPATLPGHQQRCCVLLERSQTFFEGLLLFCMLASCFFQVIDFHQTMEVNGIRFWCYTAGHVLGAAMFMVDIAGMRMLYTGDYSCEEDRHLRAAEVPNFSPDVCIIESTYGVQIHQPRAMRERRFTDTVAQTVSQVLHVCGLCRDFL